MQDLETDRPDFTEGTQTVQTGRVQFEFGYTYVKNSDPSDFEEHVLPELLVRVGLIEDLELRLFWDGYISEDIDGVHNDGLGDTSIGFKHRMYRQDGLMPDLSFIAELGLPTGENDFSAEEVEPEFKLLWAYDLDSFGVAGNINFANPVGEDGRFFEIASSLALSTALSQTVGVYVEYFGFYPGERC